MPENPPNILVALSVFKGSLSNAEACESVSLALKKKKINHTVLPVGDGGRGTMESVKSVHEGEFVEFEVSRPIDGKTSARVLAIPDGENPSQLYIESAEACGAHLIDPSKRDAMRASSSGLGELLKKSYQKWGDSIYKVIIGLGDSGISDAGMGLLSSVGVEFYDAGGNDIWGNAHGLRQIKEIKLPEKRIFPKAEFLVLCDVMNPLCGSNGSAQVFAPQKGATASQVKLIEEGMLNMALNAEKVTGLNPRSEPMTGSAGGLSAAFYSFFSARLVRGAQYLMEWLNFDETLASHHCVITGEGRTDSQSLSGKAPFECLQRAFEKNKKAILISGQLEKDVESSLAHHCLLGVYECGDTPSAKEALRKKTLEIFSDKKLLKAIEAG